MIKRLYGIELSPGTEVKVLGIPAIVTTTNRPRCTNCLYEHEVHNRGLHSSCNDIACIADSRTDGLNIIFKRKEE